MLEGDTWHLGNGWCCGVEGDVEWRVLWCGE